MKRGGRLQRRTPLPRSGPPSRKPGKPSQPSRVRRTTQSREDAAAWQEVRAQAYHRAGGACERCGRTVALHAGDQHLPWAMHGHHRLKRSQGGRDEIDNIACLCSGCHGHVHRNEAESRGLGWIVARTRFPGVTAVTLWDGRTVLFTSAGGYDVVPFDRGEAS